MAKVGIQLIIFAGKEKQNISEVFKDCADAGFEAIESGNLFEIYSVERLKEELKKYNLELSGVHTGFKVLESEEARKQLLEKAKGAGAKYLICSGVSEEKGLEGYKKAVETFNKTGEECKKIGLVFCYHNHAWEFEEFEGIKGIHFLGRETDPRLVKFNIDVAWVHIGGEKPAEFIEKYKDRCGYYHFKDVKLDGKKITWVALGKGEVDLKGAYEVAMKYDPVYFIYEQDKSDDIKGSIIESRKYLKKLGI